MVTAPPIFVEKLLALPLPLMGALVLGVWALIAILVHRVLVPRIAGEDGAKIGRFEAEVASQLGIVLGLLLSFNAVTVWEQSGAAREATLAEASSLREVHELLPDLPADQQQPVRSALAGYLDYVIHDEWPAMEQGHPPAASAVAAAENLYRLYGTLGLGPVGRIPTYDAALSGLDDLDDARGARLLAATQGLPLGFWLVLVVGGAVVVGFAYLFAVEDRTTHAVLVVALATTIVLFLILVRGLSEPYAEPLRIGTRGYTRVFDLADVMRSPGPAPVPAATPSS